MTKSMSKRPSIEVTGFWMKNDSDGYITVLVQHKGRWLRVFDNKGPGPAARDADQIIDHMIHAGGVLNLVEHGTIHPRARRTVKLKPKTARKR